MSGYGLLARLIPPWTVCLATLAVIGGGRALALDPVRAVTQYGHDTWTYRNGLPGEAVYQVAQSADGYLWLRMSNGLVRFDGARFEAVEPRVAGRPVRQAVRAIHRAA